jgi:hypothetical protein
MKRCSQCGQTYTDEDDLNYCLSDGSLLVADSGGFRSSGEMPTQFIPRPPVTHYPTPPQVGAAHSAKWVFPLVGILCGLVVVLGFFAFFRESPSDKAAVTQKNTEVAESPKNPETLRSPRVESTPVPPPPSPPPSSNKQTDYPVVTVNSPRDGYLALKSEPCTAPCGALLIKIPHRTRLALGTCKDYLEVADRRRGRWCYTSYGGYTGWIFDAFVTR